MQVKDFLDLYRQGERYFAYVDLSGASLSGANLRDIDFTGANLTGVNFSWASLNHAKFTGACLQQADLHSANLNSAFLEQANLCRTKLSKVDLRSANLQEADFSWATAADADFSGAHLHRAKLNQINLERSKLNNSELVGAELMEANLQRASLIGTNLTGANLREAHLEEANLRDAILVGSNLTEADLSAAYLRAANLSEADLHRTILVGADLSEANLNNADLSRANLTGAYLLKASLRKAYLLRAILQEVYLLRADLSEANLRGADLRRADLSGAYLSDATLTEANLSEAYLLETHLIRTNLDQAQMTGCCIDNWHIDDVDLSKVDCRYVFKQFNYATKSPSDRYPVGRDLEAGELGRQYQEDSTIIQVCFSDSPNWEALVFALSYVELDSAKLRLNIKSYESKEGKYLLRLTANHTVNGETLAARILQVYPEILQRLTAQRLAILNLLQIGILPDNVDGKIDLATGEKSEPTEPLPDPRLRTYQDVANQMQRIIMSQPPEQLVASLQRLLEFLKRQNIPTEEIQKKVVGQIIVRRARQDKTFQKQLLQWEKTADEEVRISPVGESLRLAIALLLSQPQHP